MKLGLVREFFGAQIQDIDDALSAYLSELSDPRDHYSMIRYHFGFSESGRRLASGKRMRAIFCLLIGRATGAPPPALRTVMLASELMHGASLVHDDVEDGDATRWGRPTVWSQFGTSQAVNVGDAMIGMTYELLLRLADVGTPCDVVMRVLNVYNEAHLRMSEGQHLDLVHERNPQTTIATYLDTIARKTATACECPSRASAVIAQRDRDVEEHYARFGRAFGMLYQIVDDVAGIWGDPEETGKPELGDLIVRKASLPVLYGYLHGSRELRDVLTGARPGKLPAAHRAKLTAEEAVRVRDELTQLGVPELCRQHIVHFRDEAIASLQATRNTSAEIGMLEMMTTMCAQMAGVAPEVPPSVPMEVDVEQE